MTLDGLTRPSNSHIYAHHVLKLRQFNNWLQLRLRINVLEALLLTLYIIVVLSGQVVYWLNSFFLTDNQYLTDQSQSDIIVHGNYFTEKRNIINQWFVKRGWGWTSVVILALLYSLSRSKRASTKHMLMMTLRYAFATIWWIFFTQWFFGKPLMDKIFIATGGKCTSISSDSSKLVKYILKNPELKRFLKSVEMESGSFLAPGPVVPQGTPVDTGSLKYEAQISSAVCRKIGGKWAGGHDPSGHCFLLVHSSLFILFELIPLFPHLLRSLYENNKLFYQTVNKSETLTLFTKSLIYTTPEDVEKPTALPVTKDSRVLQFVKILIHPLVLALSLVSLWTWMLLITTVYFHSLPELLAGTFAGYLEILLVYVGSRFL